MSSLSIVKLWRSRNKPSENRRITQEGLMEETKAEAVTLDPMACPKMPCKCGREARVHPETGKAFKHRIGPAHPGHLGMHKSKRRETWCPEVAE